MTAAKPNPVVEVPASGQSSDYSGSTSPAFTNSLLNSIISAGYLPNHNDAKAKGKQAEITLGVLRAFKPTDAIEGMIAAQAIAMHFGAMECFRRAMIPDQPSEVAARMRKDGANLARGVTDMVDALDRKRGKGPQVVRVERVVVHQGGQAIVGTVQAGAAAAASSATPSPQASVRIGIFCERGGLGNGTSTLAPSGNLPGCLPRTPSPYSGSSTHVSGRAPFIGQPARARTG